MTIKSIQNFFSGMNLYQKRSLDLPELATLETSESFWQKHKVACIVAGIVSIITAVALAALYWPAAFALGSTFLGATLSTLPIGAKIVSVVGGAIALGSIAAMTIEKISKRWGKPEIELEPWDAREAFPPQKRLAGVIFN